VREDKPEDKLEMQFILKKDNRIAFTNQRNYTHKRLAQLMKKIFGKLLNFRLMKIKNALTDWNVKHRLSNKQIGLQDTKS